MKVPYLWSYFIILLFQWEAEVFDRIQVSISSDLLHIHHEETKNQKFLDAAISNAEMALQALEPEKDMDYQAPARMVNLGVMLTTRYELDGRPEDFYEAIRITGTAERLSDEEGKYYAHSCYSLSNLLASSYERDLSIELLEYSVQNATRAVEKVEKDNKELPA